jgi:predicted AlkP superfamily pyrophosphatase or phosphodiesterase
MPEYRIVPYHKAVFYTVLWVLVFAFGIAAGQNPITDLKPTVILISLDGYRNDYPEKYHPPMMESLIKDGVRAKWLIPSFPTKTFPNHYTIATGLYPEHHGIVENNIFDFGQVFTIDNRASAQDPRWWQGEPIWVTAERQGQRAASYFFPGTGTAIEGVKPTYFKEYNGKAPNALRVDTILSWLDLPAPRRPTMLTLYFSDADDAGHEFSPDSEETRYAVLAVDESLRRLVDGLKARGIYDKTNIIVVSDHGMAAVKRENAVFLDDIVDAAQTDRILWTGEIVQIFPKAEFTTKILSDLARQVKHATCWAKSAIPARLHYNANDRIAPIVCSADEGWVLTNHKRYDEWRDRDEIRGVRGAHGYDNQLASMRAIFVARGPAFRNSAVVEPFANVDIYNIMAAILHLVPAKNDGSQETVRNVMRAP